jgi:hypothetical protein
MTADRVFAEATTPHVRSEILSFGGTNFPQIVRLAEALDEPLADLLHVRERTRFHVGTAGDVRINEPGEASSISGTRGDEPGGRDAGMELVIEFGEPTQQLGIG